MDVMIEIAMKDIELDTDFSAATYLFRCNGEYCLINIFIVGSS